MFILRKRTVWRPNRKRLILLVALALVVTGFGVYRWVSATHESEKRTDNATTRKNPTPTPKPVVDTSIRLVGAGDMLPHDTVVSRAKTSSGYDFTQFLDQVQPYFSQSDIRFCNQESVSAPSLGVSGYPSFNAPAEFPRDLSKFGCNLINLSNNHIADKGTAGIAGTIEVWEGLKPLAFTGANRSLAEQQTIKYFEMNGAKFAFVSFTDLSNNRAIPAHAVNMFSDQLINSLVSTAAANSDFVIASAHWGTEDSATVNTSQRAWAKKLADAGVDLVIGTGPHVLQPAARIKTARGETLVYYSIGNLLSTQLLTEELIGGIPVVDLEVQGQIVTIKQARFMPTYMHYEWTASEKAAQNLLARRNLDVYPLDKATNIITKSQLGTTVPAQTSRVTQLMNQETTMPVITSDQF